MTFLDYNADGQKNMDDLSAQAKAYSSKAETGSRSSALDSNNDWK
ncbi:MAG: hypothetical protein ACYC2T_05910 [Bacillota bacterium]